MMNNDAKLLTMKKIKIVCVYQISGQSVWSFRTLSSLSLFKCSEISEKKSWSRTRDILRSNSVSIVARLNIS